MLLESLAYSREAVAVGEWWRLPASSLAHLSVAHLLGNLLAASLLVTLLRGFVAVHVSLAVLCAGALGVGAGVHWATSLTWYVGLSGAIHALIAYGALRFEGRRRWVGPTIFAACLLQVAFDQTRSLSWLGEPLAPQAHAWGFATGTLIALVAMLRRLPARLRPLILGSRS